MSTIASAGLLGFSAGAAVGGAINNVTTLVVLFTVVNSIAAVAVISARRARGQRLITRS